MKKRILFAAFTLIFITNVFSDELSEGYSYFIKNDIKQAFQHFIAATQVAETKSEAYLMLCLLSTVEKDDAKAFNYFLNFYKSSPNTDPYTMALFHHHGVLGYSSLKTKDQLNWLLELKKRQIINSTLKAYVSEELGNYYEYVYDIKKSKENFLNIGAIMDWQIVGDFENISASGFDKDYGPLNHPESDAIFKNKINAEVKWFDLYKKVSGKWIDFTNNFNCNNTLVYAQTFCNSPSDQIIYLRVGTSGSLKLWVNDQLLFKEEEERNNGLDTYIVPVKVYTGNNRILLQIASSKIDRNNFMMRVTDNEGNFQTNLTFSSKYKPYNKTVQEYPKPIISNAEEFLLSQIQENPDKLLNYLVLANAYLANDKIHDAMNILLQAQKIAPNCSFILNQLCELYIRDKNRTATSLTQEKLKLIDPNSSDVLNYIIDNAFYSQNYKEARQYIEKEEQLYGENFDVLYYKIKLASSENKAEEYSSLIDKAYKLFPDEYTFAYDKYQFEKDYKKNPKTGLKFLKDFTKKYFNVGALKELSATNIELGQGTEGIEVLKKLIEYRPFDDDFYNKIGIYYLQNGNYNMAQSYLEECLKIAPFYGPYYGNYAKLFEEKGEKDKAISEYKKNIIYSPGDYEALKKIRNLESKKEIFDYFPVKDYYKIFDDSPNATDYPSDNILSLTEDHQVVLYENGGCELRQIYMFKALTLKGIDNLKEYKINYTSNENLTIEKAEILKKNGNRLQAEVKDNQIVYTSLEPGDAVFLIFKKSKIISGQMSKQFYEKMLLSAWYPTLNIEYDLLADKNIKFDYKLDNSDVKTEITDQDEFKLYTWRKVSKKGFQTESYMPALMDVTDLISISTLPDWNYISKWYYDISNTKTKPDETIIETVNDLLKGKENYTELEKAKIFYNYIEKNIRYSSVSFRQSGIVPQNASDVLITKIGDCKDMSVLFNSMCKVVGINNEVVLLQRRQNGMNWMNLPSFDFDHAISKAILDKKEYYIELTSPYYPFAALGESQINAIILEVNNDSNITELPKLLSPTTRKPNNVYREAKVIFNSDNMTSTISTFRTGVFAANTRSYYRDLGKEEREKNFTKSITENYSNTKLLSLNFSSSLNDCSDTVSYSYSFISPNVFTKINDLSILKLPLTEQLTPFKFLSIEDRKFPIEKWEYGVSDTLIENLTIVFPEKKKLAELPKSVHYSCNQEDYTLSFNVYGNELHVIRKMISKKDNVPVSDYSSYRSFIESVVTSDNQQIGFK